ncbi:PKD domain-containing protein [Candidatus Peregrinibacteria bacterium]|nr:PKD domain-containing protein [Candidatus Peregrinibacteria bacterium]
MAPRSISHWVLLTLLVSGIAVGYDELYAQSQRETVTIAPGTVFEIIALTELPDAQVSWVLTEERTFLEAGRNRIFRTRLTKPGTYILDGGIFSALSDTRLRKTIEIIVRPQEGPLPLQGSGAAASAPTIRLVETTPSLRGENVVIAPEGILIVTPIRTGAPLILDVDTETDGNGDGNPANDRDSDGTFFQTDGTTLHLWMASQKPKRTMQITAAPAGTAPITQRISVLTSGIGATENAIVSQTKENGEVEFRMEFQGNEPPPGPLLTHWYFGDGMESLLEAPIHRYASNDTYTVHVSVISLQSGTEILSLEKTLTITNAGPIPTETGGSIPPPAQPSDDGGLLSGWIFFLFRLLLAVLVAFGIGALIVYLYRKLRGGVGLQKKLEEVESTIVTKKSPKEVIDVPAAPMEIKRPEAPPAQPAKTSPPVTETKAVPPPVTAPSPTPPPPARSVATDVPPPPPPPKESPKQTELPAWLKEPPRAPTPAAKPATPPPPPAKPATPPPPPVKPAPPPPAPPVPRPVPRSSERSEVGSPAQRDEGGKPAPTPPPAPKKETPPQPPLPKKEPPPPPAPPLPPPPPPSPPAPQPVTPAPAPVPPPPAPTPSKPVIPTIPKEQPIEKAKPEENLDTPIAIIKAESISKEEPKK